MNQINQWKYYFFFVIAVLFIWSIRKGWQLGLGRSFCQIISLFVAWNISTISASFLAFMFVYYHPTNMHVTLATFLFPCIIFFLTILVFYLILNIIPALFIKRTAHQHGFLKLIFGIGGICGSIFFVLLLTNGIKSFVDNFAIIGENFSFKKNSASWNLEEKITYFFLAVKNDKNWNYITKQIQFSDFLSKKFGQTIASLYQVSNEKNSKEKYILYRTLDKYLPSSQIISLFNNQNNHHLFNNTKYIPYISPQDMWKTATNPHFLTDLKKLDISNLINHLSALSENKINRK